MRPVSLYIHTPFCKRRCSYCTFYHLPYDEAQDRAYLAAVVNELGSLKREFGPLDIQTVFFGGGTPTVLQTASLDRILGAVRDDISSAAEITVEANPEDIDGDKMRALRGLGVNRVSIGIQSMQPKALHVLKRCSAELNARAIATVKEHFDNFSVDLLIGIPGSTSHDVRETLDRILEFAPPHMSLYCLEPGGPMQRDVADFFTRVDSEQAADEYLAVCARLGDAGYRHYEVSNFAREGRLSRHNFAYWDGSEYLGAGPSAHSFMGGSRFHNEASLPRYIAAFGGDGAHATAQVEPGVRGAGELRGVDERGPEEKNLEALMLGLRTERGAELGAIRNHDVLEALVDEQLAFVEGGRLVLRARGYLLLNEIVERLSRDPARG
jgi:oxygen-independent coproporphyrinogen-3 oxidase